MGKKWKKRRAGRVAPKKCVGCAWNKYRECGVDWCVLPKCMTEGGGVGLNSSQKNGKQVLSGKTKHDRRKQDD